jgi:predicted acylesterase/phospholipase RssA
VLPALRRVTAVLDKSSRPARTIFVLGGGGSLGAYQVGALVGLARAGHVPDALFGCSAGALNAAFLAGDPTLRRAQDLVGWWSDRSTHSVLAPSRLTRMLGIARAATGAQQGLIDPRPLRRLISRRLEAHDLAELAVPLTVTTTCLDCGDAVHHDRGSLIDVLQASCALPGLMPAVQLSDGHRHVDGGVVCGVPLGAAIASAGPDDTIFVLDCALAPVTGRAGECAALGATGAAGGCRLPADLRRSYLAPAEGHRGALELMLSSFAVARAVASRASVVPHLDDPRVRVVPHVADAWSAGLLEQLPRGPRDCSLSASLVAAGQAATEAWLDSPLGSTLRP